MEGQYSTVRYVSLGYFYLMLPLADKKKPSEWIFTTQKRFFSNLSIKIYLVDEFVMYYWVSK